MLREKTFLNSCKFQIVQGDITQASVDAVVNAANSIMLGGGGVDGAIHKAAGPELLEACKKVKPENGIRCPTGEARITDAGNLKAKYVIHTVGPVYSGSDRDKELLKNSYNNSLALAAQNGIKSISFPAISTGIFGYPLKEAAAEAISTVIKFLKENNEVKLVRFVLFDQESFETHKDELAGQLK